jgi:hypothetical protein
LVYRNLALIALLLAAISAPVMAGGSVFSGNGVGEQLVGGGTRAQGLGGGGLGLADSMSFNSDNPALSAYSVRTLLRMAGQVGVWETSANGRKDSDGEFVWQDFFVYFPVLKSWRMGLGAVPRNHMDLRLFENRTAIFQDTAHTRSDTVHFEEQDAWQGSRVDLRFENSVKVSDKLAVGLSTAYILLRNERDRTLALPSVEANSYYYGVGYSEIETFRGFSFGLGGYYEATPKLGLGLVYRPRIPGHWDYTNSKGGGTTIHRSRSGDAPGEIDFGACYKLSPRFVGVGDVRAGQWAAGDLGIISDSAGTITPENPLFVSVGFERMAGKAPAATGFETWAYRAGLYYRKHYWPLRNGAAVSDYAVTAGLSVPIAGHAGWLHIAAEGGMRGQDETKLGAKETFFRGSLQLEMSETWFERTKPRIPK